jgi:predicted dehydrogenase
VEKPFVFDETKGEELINLAKRNNLLLMVAHVVRFMPPYQKLKKWVDDKTYGDLKFLSLTRFSGVPKWGQWIEKQNSFGSSGGALFDLVLHDIDFATFITGQSPEKVNSTILPGYLSKHDYVNANWQFAGSNLLVKVEGGNLFHSPFPFQAGFMAQFENASVYFSTLNSEFIFVAFDDKTEEVAAGDLNDGYCNEISYFYDCIENGKQPKECMPESSLETIRVCFKHI